jgi:hypothetical protein
MASNRFDRDDANASLRWAHGSQRALQSEDVPSASMRDMQGKDPYNSSGSFDRRKNWERVRKR